MPAKAPGRVIDLQNERLRRGMPRYHREPMQTWRRKVKLTVAGVCLLGILAGLLSVAMESTDTAPGDDSEGLFGSPFRSSSGAAPDVDEESAWFTTTGGGRR
ncbi:hypothetical protein NR798_47315 [Archangium gephyra]|uniref:hypothetical protein n=1 Tax=Archangium gephyra TaxID=48 RepID=UPI0035D44541